MSGYIVLLDTAGNEASDRVEGEVSLAAVPGSDLEVVIRFEPVDGSQHAVLHPKTVCASFGVYDDDGTCVYVGPTTTMVPDRDTFHFVSDG